jgi:hypothetical protein
VTIGFGLAADPRVLSFSARVLRYDSDNDAVLLGAMGELSVYVPEHKRDAFPVDGECIVTISALKRTEHP